MQVEGHEITECNRCDPQGFSSLVFLLTGFGTVAGKSPADTLAMKGYDTVVYFKAANALKGRGSFTFPWHGVTWHFSTNENRDLFAASPEKYAPQYDG